MEKTANPKQARALILLCAVAYFISYLTRLNYAAVTAEFIAESGLPKATVALPVTALSITYGIGQLISGYLGDRIKPRHIMTAGFIITTLMNFAMPLAAPNITLMTVVWACNGFAQAMMWPPLVKIMTSALDRETYNRATVLVSYGSSAGTITVYLTAPLFITLASGWRTVFYFAGCCSAVIVFIFNLVMNRFERAGIPQPVLAPKKKTAVSDGTPKEAAQTADTGNGTKAAIRALGLPLLFIMLAIVFQGMIRDGITAWMPTFIGDTYNLGTSISILSGVILPIFSILSFEVTSFIHKKWFTNELLCSGVIALVAAVCAALLLLTLDISAVFAIILSAMIVACMHGVNLVLICMLPASFSRFGNVSMISGLLNFCTYIGAAISTYGMAKIADILGWNAVIVSWIVIALLIAGACFVCVKKWRDFVSVDRR